MSAPRPPAAPAPRRSEYLVNVGVPLGVLAIAVAGIFVDGDGAERRARLAACATDPVALAFPAGIAVDDAGLVYVTQQRAGCVVRMGGQGPVEVVVGGDERDGCPGCGTELEEPTGVVAGPGGALAVLQSGGRRIVRLSARGQVSEVAVDFDTSTDLASDAAGNLYAASPFGSVSRIDPDGNVVPLTSASYRGGLLRDGALAREVRVDSFGVHAGDDGSLLLTTYDNLVVRITPDGRLAIVAGTGVEGFSGDGGPATAAKLARPRGITADPAGNVYVADYANNRVRRIDPAGIITTVAGTGTPFGLRENGDGGPATEALLTPGDLAWSGGSLYITDSYDGRVRVVDPSGIIRTLGLP